MIPRMSRRIVRCRWDEYLGFFRFGGWGGRWTTFFDSIRTVVDFWRGIIVEYSHFGCGGDCTIHHSFPGIWGDFRNVRHVDYGFVKHESEAD
jgi:hypothetical protein